MFICTSSSLMQPEYGICLIWLVLAAVCPNGRDQGLQRSRACITDSHSACRCLCNDGRPGWQRSQLCHKHCPHILAHLLSSIFHLPSSIFHLPPSILHLPSTIFHRLCSVYSLHDEYPTAVVDLLRHIPLHPCSENVQFLGALDRLDLILPISLIPSPQSGGLFFLFFSLLFCSLRTRNGSHILSGI